MTDNFGTHDWVPVDPNPPDEPPPAYVLSQLSQLSQFNQPPNPPVGPGYAATPPGYFYAPPAGGHGYAPPFGSYYPAPNERPASVVGAAVIVWIVSGLLLIGGLLLLLGASLVHDASDEFAATNTSLTAELIVDGAMNFLTAGLLIAGGIGITSRRRNARPLLVLGACVCFIASIDWMTKGTDAIFWAILFAAPVIIALCLAWTQPATRWLSGEPPPLQYPPSW